MQQPNRLEQITKRLEDVQTNLQYIVYALKYQAAQLERPRVGGSEK